MSSQPNTLSRRSFFKSTAAVGAGLVIGTRLAFLKGPRVARAAEPAAPPPLEPNAFVRIAPDNTVTILSKHIEFGQGTYTGLATLIAEELDADWSQMRAEAAPAAPVYKNLFFGVQGTGGSTAIANSFMQMRQVGAAARAMLVGAAAAKWGVAAGEITVDKGVVSHPSGEKAMFGELAEAAMKLPVPKGELPLKSPEQFKLIGKRLPKLDTPAKLDGAARFGLDVVRPNMVTAVVLRPPLFGATPKDIDASDAEKVAGFVKAAPISSGVAVYADGFWPASLARQRLKVTWDESKAEKRGTKEIISEFKAKLSETGKTATERGQADERIAAPTPTDRVLKADFVFPYLAHAPMEPLDAVIERTADGGVEAWYGCQFPGADQPTLAKVLKVPPDKVKLNVLFGGGSFGRRAQGDASFAVEAATALTASPEGRPVKLVWTREDDIRGGYYRPIYVHRLEAVVDEGGAIAAWRHRIVGQSIMAGTPFGGGEIDQSSVEGAANLPYAIPSFRVELATQEVGVPVLWWRSVGSTHTAYSTETFLDEVLELAGKDPVEGRLELLAEHPRHAGVLRAVAEMAKWGQRAPQGRAYGVAVHESFHSYVAQIAEVGLDQRGMPKVHKVWCAVDCGIAINPNIIEAQMESGIGYGLGAALYNAIDLVAGRVVQRNFDGYRPLRIGDMPDIEVRVVRSSERPTGVGEPGTPVIAPAVANAFYRLTKRRVRSLPFIRHKGGAA